MFTPTALMNPTITPLDTKRSRLPRRRRPAVSMMTPVTIESVNSARPESEAFWIAPTSAIRIDMAPVACTAMNAELVTKAPATVPTM